MRQAEQWEARHVSTRFVAKPGGSREPDPTRVVLNLRCTKNGREVAVEMNRASLEALLRDLDHIERTGTINPNEHTMPREITRN